MCPTPRTWWSALRWSLHPGGQGLGGQPDHTGVGGLIGGEKTETKTHNGVGLIGGLIGGFCFPAQMHHIKVLHLISSHFVTFVCLVSADMPWRSPQRYVQLAGTFTVPAGQWDNELSSRWTSHQMRLDAVIDY